MFLTDPPILEDENRPSLAVLRSRCEGCRHYEPFYVKSRTGMRFLEVGYGCCLREERPLPLHYDAPACRLFSELENLWMYARPEDG